MNNCYPDAENDPQWKEARVRLDAYLRALHIAASEREPIVHKVLTQAAIKFTQNPAETPVALAMDYIREHSEEWFGKLLAERERAQVTGLVSWYALEAPEKWPAVFLADKAPAEFQEALAGCEVRAAPDLRFASMVPQPFDNPLRDMSLPSALGILTQDVTPSLVGKVAAVLLSGLSIIWSGNRLR